MGDSGLRSALLETMGGLMSTDQGERGRAEEQVKALEVTDQFGLHLTELTLQHDASLPLRQLSSVLLKQYIDSHWSPDAAKFRAPECPPATKAAVRALLPLGLKESISKVSHVSRTDPALRC